VLERFHVCPLLFREKMEGVSSVGRGRASAKRPVYRYVFTCPGPAQAMVSCWRRIVFVAAEGTDSGRNPAERFRF